MIEELKNQLDLAQDDDNTTLEEIEDIRRKLCAALREEEMLWQQKSREKWHKDGDKNTKFFHALTKQRRARNRIVSLKDSSGHLVENARGIGKVVSTYFQDLFSSSIHSDPENSLRFNTEKVSDNTNQLLLKDPSEKEMKDALFDINPDKAPGPDVSFQVLINGEPEGNIKPSRGLRQGDPLSPFLFILCTEGLISLLKGAEEEERISGLKIAQASPPVSHLLFADDSLFFCKADMQQGAEILRIINTYGMASGQQLKLGKSSIMFGDRVDPDLKRSVKNTIGISTEGGMGMYLGLPEQICGSKKEDMGGLGFRDLNDFNLALLAKKIWRLIQYPSSLLARVLRGRYYRQSDPLEDRNVYSPSYGWRSMLAAKPYLKMGLRKTIGSGLNTRVWSDSWIPDARARPPRATPQIGLQDPGVLVYSFIRQDTKQWDEPLLREFFQPEDVSLILGLRPSRNRTLDGFAWNHTKSGIYTLKSGYDLIRKSNLEQNLDVVREPSITALQSYVWKVRTPGKMKHFMWQALSGCIATCQNLTYRHMGTDKAPLWES
ncbi:uncharacterized protein LOC112089224 [Eutrema salsugineum]|uniref:uncharacterized protein LOC112089224 n=1 Tax=Eutrema salsugineum TaxID=72664 RepID=UPI000CED105C|nr:uncharacterized protein LOC112089224 [Eutrema salsugineum]